jgi:uncharacterized protein YndB with AHSA1/START domain
MNQIAVNAPAKTEGFSMERLLAAQPDEVWRLWTSKAGIESWWGPDGFEVTVKTMELRPGGELVYVMTAVGDEQIAFMEGAGLPVSTTTRLVYTDVAREHRLAYKLLVDFVPGVTPYEIGTQVEMQPMNGGTKLTLTFDPMHDDLWTGRMRAGQENQLVKLETLLARQSEDAN